MKEDLLLGRARQMIVMLKDNLNIYFAYSKLNIDWNQIKPRGTFTRFNVERTYQTLKMTEIFSMKKNFPNKTIQSKFVALLQIF